MVHRFFHARFTFQFRPCSVYRSKLWIKDDKWDCITLHTNRSLLATLRYHAFPSTYAELEMPNWNTPLAVKISMEVLYIEINKRLVCKKSSHETSDIMAFHCVTTCSNCVISRAEYSFLSAVLSWVHQVWEPGSCPELVWDSESEEAGVPSDSFSEDEGGFEDESGVSTKVFQWSVKGVM